MSAVQTLRCFLILMLVLLVSGCTPRPASEESGGDDLAASSVGFKPENAGLPFDPSTGKLTEEDMRKILEAMTPEEATQVNLRFVCVGLLHFRDLYGRYPTEEEGLALFLAPPMTPGGEERPPLGPEILIRDGWKNPIQYRAAVWENGVQGFEVSSLGPDGAPSEDDIRPDYMEEIIKTGTMIEAGVLEEMRAKEGR